MVFLIDAACFGLLLLLSFFMMKEFSRHHALNRAKGYFASKLGERREDEEFRIKEDGNGAEVSLLYRMDLALYQSGISKKFPFMASELFFVLTAVAAVGSFILALLMSGNIVLSLVIPVALVFLEYTGITLTLSHNTSLIEEDILKFANLLDNYSHVSDDLIAIMDHTWIYLNEPLKSAVKSCCTECRTGENAKQALKRLELSIRHRQFTQLIRNLEMCSRYNADYSSVIRKNRDLLENYLSQKELRKQMANSSRINILILYAGAFLVIKIMEGIGEEGVLEMLFHSFTGNAILGLCFLVFLYSLRQMLVMGKK